MKTRIDNKLYGQLVEEILKGAKKATKYLDEKTVVKATYRGKLVSSSPTHEILITLGAPNFAERKFIKACKKAGEPFPIKKIQLKFLSK